MRDSRPKYRRNVAAVIMDARGNVLVGRKKADSRFIHFPQGGVEKKETFEQALWREIKEEVGLNRDSLTIVAHIAGLSYDYRKKNKKREKWAGQEQTYYLIRYSGDGEVMQSRESNEFGVLQWLPYRELSPESFVSFKRDVVSEVLKTFFPCDMQDFETHAQSLNTLLRYRFSCDSGLSDFSPYDRAFFVGGKQEALAQMADLRERICRAQQQLHEKRVLILLADANPDAKRRTNCLRRIAEVLDPILTRVPRPHNSDTTATLLASLVQFIPNAGEILFMSESVYTQYWEHDLWNPESVSQFEQLLMADGVTVLKFFLYITPEQWAKVGGCYDDYLEKANELLQSTAHPVAWHIIPSEKKWYRDYVLASIVAQSLENLIASL